MEIVLTPEQEAFVTQAVVTGRVKSPADAVQDALNVWVERERVRMELVASLDNAADSIEAGEYTEYDEESLAKLPIEVFTRNKIRRDAAQCASA